MGTRLYRRGVPVEIDGHVPTHMFIFQRKGHQISSNLQDHGGIGLYLFQQPHSSGCAMLMQCSCNVPILVQNDLPQESTYFPLTLVVRKFKSQLHSLAV